MGADPDDGKGDEADDKGRLQVRRDGAVMLGVIACEMGVEPEHGELGMNPDKSNENGTTYHVMCPFKPKREHVEGLVFTQCVGFHPHQKGRETGICAREARPPSQGRLKAGLFCNTCPEARGGRVGRCGMSFGGGKRKRWSGKK